ncbi:hypothetical protein [Mastigocladopsis repens]|uniref:hypothetical protein n=1 Tax=Mastigocladopsis repens TaxID=221287 RepID=UPI0002E2A1DD|nr:hypothetical protein [Mastigocladopsis repens]
MQGNQKECQVSQEITSAYERLSAALMEIQLLHEQVEFLRELVESENLNRRHEEQKLQELKQELKMTNQELSTALMEDRLSLDEAKELARILLKSEKSARVSFAELLTTIYGCAVKPEELQQIDSLNMKTVPLKKDLVRDIFANSNKLKHHSKQLSKQYEGLGWRFMTMKDLYSKIQAYWTECKTKQ